MPRTAYTVQVRVVGCSASYSNWNNPVSLTVIWMNSDFIWPLEKEYLPTVLHS